MFGVYRVSCMLSVACECVSSNHRDASTAVYARRMAQTKWNNREMENGLQQQSVQQNCIIDDTSVHCRYRRAAVDSR